MNNKNEDVNSDELQTKNTNTKNTREKVDKVIDTVGSDSLQKLGVPKFIADKAIKDGGGKFSPSNSSLTKNISRNFLANQINKLTKNNSKQNTEDVDDQELENQEKEKKKEYFGDYIKETGKSVIKDKIKKQALLFIAKNPYVLAVLGAAIIIALFIFLLSILLSMDFDFAGSGNQNPEYYNFNCSQIYLVWENEDYLKKNNLTPITPGMVDLTNTERYSFKQLDINSYVTGIVWTDNKNAGDVNNDTVYQLMSIVARSRIVASLPSNCVVLRDYNSENFTELNGSEERYNEIVSAVNETDGIIISKNNTVIDAKYDAFSYTENDSSFFYHMMNTNERGEQVIPASWVSENSSINPLKVSDTTYLESLSLYGSKYLLEQVNSQYDLYRTLEEYFGKDIEYYTIGNTSNGILECSSIDFYKTSLSRDEFIKLVMMHLIGNLSKTANLFRDNAGLIYDLGLQMNANPEMVYIVAEKEQGWNDTDFTIRCNNFYGMGVVNGSNSGICYDSFEDGVKAMLDYINKTGSLNSFVKTYSYLGTYLANPGSSGDGGCYYLTLSDIYGSNYSRCSSNYQCASSDGGPGCVLTTEAEKQAYIDWQAKKITKIRSDIFHISEEICTDYSIDSAQVGEAAAIPLSERIDWLFPNGLPKSQNETLAYMTTITVPVTTISGTQSTMSLTVHKKLANEIQAIFTEMANIKFPINSIGGYAYRQMASGTGHLSHHSYGVAIDINPNENPAVYWNYSPNTSSPYYINSTIVALWKKHGFYWGGDWTSNYYDPMHFTYTNH